MPDMLHTPAEARAATARWRARGQRVALVPTMGALHAGHLALVRAAQQVCDRVVASVFVNPTQFAPHEDLDRYPRQLAADTALLAEAGCDAVYAPTREIMYPNGFSTSVKVGGVSAPLEGEFRPHFFEGVATVVAKLLVQCAPDVAVFGEKDWQQLQVVKAMTRDLDLAVEILGVPTVREPDGLALSSRNAYLPAGVRAAAPALHAALAGLRDQAEAGAWSPEAESRATIGLLAAGFERVDYLCVRDAASLGPTLPGRARRALGAAWLSGTRLIDNIAVAAGD